MTMHSAHISSEPKAIRAKKLYNGGVILELNSPKVVQWLRKEKAIFAEEFGDMSVVKDREITVIIEYVLILHSPDVLAENRRIEWDSGLDKGSLISMRWVKPVQR